MRTNVVLDGELVEEAMRLTGSTTKREVIHRALTLLVRSRKRKSLSSLKGKIRFADRYDYKRLRAKSR